jgi:hypothetical protein
MKSETFYILYIYIRENYKREAEIMAVANVNTIDDKLKEMYAQQLTVNNAKPFEDRSEVLFAQMNFIAMANRQRFNLI